MSKLILQNIADDISSDSLPVFWQGFDLVKFSKEKTIYDFQQEALKNALKILWRYYQEENNYQVNEKFEINDRRKEKLYGSYSAYPSFPGVKADYDLTKKEDKKSAKLLKEFYPVSENKISFKNFINRMAFWMATGSGKTLIIIKLIEILGKLIQRKEIPPNDILYLTYRDDLIKQFKNFIKEFNDFYKNEIQIRLESLKNYDNVKRNPSIFSESGEEIIVFYYRSDNLSDLESKKKERKILNFKTKENQGKWYILLDEAHKGDKEDSKRQAIYSILSRQGFLFNFSATFVDPRDFLTTVYNFNLEKFIQNGYGKHIYLSEEEINAFRDKTNFSEDEKQRIVLKSLILLTYIKKFAHKVKKIEKGLYHYPLLLALVNSVNTKDADLKLFFREIEKIGQGKAKNIFQRVKKEILNDFKGENKFQFEEGEFKIDEKSLSKIKYQDILKEVFNSKSSGGIEVLKIPGNKKELIFKLKKSDRPFALIKIGDISSWLKEQLEGYEINESYDNKSVFEQMNKDDSEINILMGSRAFYEGWDSNRPNIILFINIGIGSNAKKFVLQSVGRGVRIEPEKNKRKRIIHLFTASPREVKKEIYQKIKNFVLPLETLFIFGTNIKNLKQIINTFKEEKGEGQLIGEKYIKKNPRVDRLPLLVPVYKSSPFILAEEKELAKFRLSPDDFDLTKKYFDYLEDDRVRLIYYDSDVEKDDKVIQTLKTVETSFADSNEDEYFNLDKSQSSVLNPDFELSQIFRYFSLTPEKFDKFERVEGKIVHFERIEFTPEKGKEIDKFLGSLKEVGSYQKKEKELLKMQRSLFELGKKDIDVFGKPFDGIRIKYVPNHYYYPVILSEKGEKIRYLNHIINVKSEVKFIEELEECLSKEDNLFNKFDWWLFSKLDEHTDKVYIPWHNPKSNSIDKFKPDFIFWLKKDKNYYIVFIDPKGTEHAEVYRKIDGFKDIFEGKSFSHNGFNIKVKLFCKPEDKAYAIEEYKEFWLDNIHKILEAI